MLRHLLRSAARSGAFTWRTGATFSTAACQARSSQAHTEARLAALLASASAITLGLTAGTALAEDKIRERTFIAIKPDGVQRGLIADIIKRFESKGYKLVAIKMIVPSSALASSHYAEHQGKPFFNKLVTFLTSGPVVAMVWEGDEVIKYGRTMIGTTNPLASPPGTIRGDYGVSTGRNIIHGSDSLTSAQREVALWFRPDEITSWSPANVSWLYE